MGCASGKGAGPRNIFGNKYGQNLAAVQIAREKRLEEKRRKEEEQKKQQQSENNDNDSDGEQETDDDEETDDEDYGPTPAAGIWAGSEKLQSETEKIAYADDDDDEEEPPSKKSRQD